jgi:hypothetical protein
MLRRFRRPLLPLAVLLALAPAVAGAAAPRPNGRPAVTQTQGWLIHGWAALASWWAALGGGCKIDPSGLCLEAAPPAGTDGGCGLDPSGCAGH